MLTLAEHNERVARLADHELIEALQWMLSQERGTHALLMLEAGELNLSTLKLLAPKSMRAGSIASARTAP